MFYDFITTYTDIFCRKNERSFCSAKASHIFSTKNIGIFEILKFEILTNDNVSFEQPGPVWQSCFPRRCIKGSFVTLFTNTVDPDPTADKELSDI